ncbi:MAG: efflux RND transporter permease subunit [Pseudomonadota bacterium]
MIRFFAGHPTAANLTMALMIIVGLVTAPSLLRETFPRSAPREVQVTIAYPGAAPEDVSRALCTRIEDALDGVRGIEEVRCEAIESRAVAIAEMKQGGDFARFTADVEAEVAAIDEFPDGSEDPVFQQLGMIDPVAVVALTAAGAREATELRALAEDVKTRMLRWGGIPQVEVLGFSDRQVRIEVPEAAARQLGLSLEEIAHVVGRQNVDMPLGELISADGSTRLRFADERRALDAYRDIVVASDPSGGEIRLMDIARIAEVFEDREVATELNGRPAAVLRVTKTATEDTLRVMDALRAFLDEERARMPPGVELTITGDASGVLNDRLEMLLVNSLQGLALVFAAIWLFFGLRQAFWIAFGLPVSFLGALAAMTVLGYSINMLTLVGLLMVIGILMDDAIVIAENIETKRAAGLSPLDAAVAGARQVAPGVIASFATTVAVFGSLAFLDGKLGEILSVIPVVMILVLSVSLIEAFLILPAHLSHGAPAEPDPPRLADRWLDAFRRRVVGPAARAAVAWRWLTVGLALMAFLGSVATISGGVLKFQAFPEIDGDQIEARLALSAGASFEETEATMAYLLAALDRVNEDLSPRNPGGASLVRDVVVTFNENEDVGGAGAHLATARVDLLAAERRGSTLDEILGAWRAAAPETPAIHRLNLTEGTLGPAGRAIEIRLAHDRVEPLARAAEDLAAWLERYAGAYNIADNLDLGRPELRMTLRGGAGALGLDARAVADQVRAAFQGVTADVVEVGDESWEIDVRLAAANREAMSDLDNFTIETPAGAAVPFYAVADVSEGRGYAAIRRVDGRPTVTVTGDVDTAVANADEIVRDTIARFIPELEARYPGLRAGAEGQNAAAARTQSSMMSGLLIGLVIVFCVLSFQLRSYVEPVVVMAIIPFALIGAVVGHLAMGVDMSLPSMLGFASLSGIVVNDSILLVHFIKEEQAKGAVSVAEAAPKAAMARFRAILLTSVTTIVGMLPLLAETSLQAQVLIPLVASIAFGLTSTTLLILLVVPAFYVVLDDLGLTTLSKDAGASALAETRRVGSAA